jgi:glycosyltransferase involved in cell wall biosynthesis
MKPDLSVVIPTDRFETIERVVASLRRQNVRGSIELVVVTPSALTLSGHDGELEGFHSTRVVEADTASLPRARAVGIRAATSDVVAFAESHSFPEPGWAEALIAAHDGPWAAVGPAMVNPHRNGSAGWVKFLIDYGQWVPPIAPGPVDDLPGHNSSYKRGLLLEYGPELERMLDAEWFLHRHLRRRGYTLYLEPAAMSRHISVTRLVPSIVEWFHYSRGFATSRSRGWPRRRQLLYVAGSPLIVLVRLRRVIAAMRRTGQARLIARSLPLALLTLVGSAAGELVGYAVGGGEGAEGTSEYELHRERYADDYGEMSADTPSS